ncbi:recombinase family protein [Nonomuraea sp. NPDC046802]|uniref:recombinase family protein n=1 Tax=Nonomuraea sp. NPDC046802 TaxID=3154919 RepID=UPI0033FA72B0
MFPVLFRRWRLSETLEDVNGAQVSYARCSTDEQDVVIQTKQLLALGVPEEWIYIDRGFSGITRRNCASARPDAVAARARYRGVGDDSIRSCGTVRVWGLAASEAMREREGQVEGCNPSLKGGTGEGNPSRLWRGGGAETHAGALGRA